MKLRILPLIVIVPILVVMAVPAEGVSCLVQGRNAPAVAIAPELGHAAEFVEFLNRTTLRVQEVQQSHFTGMFGTRKLAALIRTDKGILEVVFLPGSSDAHKMTFTYQRDPSSNRHLYTFSGVGVEGKSETVNAAYPIYITLHRNWLIITRNCELDRTIKRALLQTNGQ